MRQASAAEAVAVSLMQVYGDASLDAQSGSQIHCINLTLHLPLTLDMPLGVGIPMNSHTKGGWYHCDFCDYKNKDKRNTDSHMRIHNTDEEDKPYECDKCGKGMRFSTQFKWHKEQGCKAECDP